MAQTPEPERIVVEVVYALPKRQSLIALEVEVGCTALDAVRRSGILAEFPEIDPAQAKMGIFSVRIKDPATYVLRAGDRVEVYRPLLIDPKAMRRQRAEKARARSEASGKASAH